MSPPFLEKRAGNIQQLTGSSWSATVIGASWSNLGWLILAVFAAGLLLPPGWAPVAAPHSPEVLLSLEEVAHDLAALRESINSDQEWGVVCPEITRRLDEGPAVAWNTTPMNWASETWDEISGSCAGPTPLSTSEGVEAWVRRHTSVKNTFTGRWNSTIYWGHAKRHKGKISGWDMDVPKITDPCADRRPPDRLHVGSLQLSEKWEHGDDTTANIYACDGTGTVSALPFGQFTLVVFHPQPRAMPSSLLEGAGGRLDRTASIAVDIAAGVEPACQLNGTMRVTHLMEELGCTEEPCCLEWLSPRYACSFDITERGVDVQAIGISAGSIEPEDHPWAIIQGLVLILRKDEGRVRLVFGHVLDNMLRDMLRPN